MNSTAPIQSLPDSVWENILQYINQPKERGRIAQVCRNFNRLRLKYKIPSHQLEINEYFDETLRKKYFKSFLSNIKAFSTVEAILHPSEWGDGSGYAQLFLQEIKYSNIPVALLSLDSIGMACNLEPMFLPPVKRLEITNDFYFKREMPLQFEQVLEHITIRNIGDRAIDLSFFRSSAFFLEILGDTYSNMKTLNLEGVIMLDHNEPDQMLPELWRCLKTLPALEKLNYPNIYFGKLTDPLYFKKLPSTVPQTVKFVRLYFCQHHFQPMADKDVPTFMELALKTLLPTTILPGTITVDIVLQNDINPIIIQHIFAHYFNQLKTFHIHLT
jgi:hypothetical protein